MLLQRHIQIEIYRVCIHWFEMIINNSVFAQFDCKLSTLLKPNKPVNGAVRVQLVRMQLLLIMTIRSCRHVSKELARIAHNFILLLLLRVHHIFFIFLLSFVFGVMTHPGLFVAVSQGAEIETQSARLVLFAYVFHFLFVLKHSTGPNLLIFR